MTREEAIAQLNLTLWMQRNQGNHYLSDALVMAIKSLEAEPCEDCVYSTKDGYCQYDDITEAIPPLEPCEDCISRQAVIKIVEQYPVIIGNRYSGLIADIEHLPSVTPQKKEAYWIEESDDEYTTIYCYRCSNCGNCNEDDTDYCPDCGCLMTDVRGEEDE